MRAVVGGALESCYAHMPNAIATSERSLTTFKSTLRSAESDLGNMANQPELLRAPGQLPKCGARKCLAINGPFMGEWVR
jgi:hypothetical protein